jgi:hypothetical protein
MAEYADAQERALVRLSTSKRNFRVSCTVLLSYAATDVAPGACAGVGCP